MTTLRGCVLCDLTEQGRIDLGERAWVHMRAWFPYGDSDYMAAEHGLTWDGLNGWVPTRSPEYVYVGGGEWMLEED